MAWTFLTVAAWYGLAAVVAVVGLAVERRERGESTASVLRGTALRLRRRSAAFATAVAPASRRAYSSAD